VLISKHSGTALLRDAQNEGLLLTQGIHLENFDLGSVAYLARTSNQALTSSCMVICASFTIQVSVNKIHLNARLGRENGMSFNSISAESRADTVGYKWSSARCSYWD